jgi:hypothetical protein
MSDERLDALALEVERFSAFLKATRRTNDLELIFDEYAYMRRTLRDGIAAVVKNSMPDARAKLNAAADRVEHQLRLRNPAYDPSLLKVRRYNELHAVILEYLSLHVGGTVTGERLRFVTGDQVHTERRLRELRELGYRIEAVRVSGADSYKLESLEQDYEQAVRSQMAMIMKRADSRASSKTQRDAAAPFTDFE